MIIDSNDKNFNEYWDKLSSKVGFYSPLYSQSSQNYYNQIASDNGFELTNISFIFIENNSAIFGFKGVICSQANTEIINFYDIPSISIEDSELFTYKSKKNILKYFDNILTKVKFISYRDYLLSGNMTIISGHLLENNIFSSPEFTQIISLKKDEDFLRKGLRKSYKSLINWGLKEINLELVDSKTITWDHIEKFKDLHIYVSGRETRSLNSWKKQFDAVKSGSAFILLGNINQKVVTAGLFMHTNEHCFYAVSASDRDLFDKPMMHCLIWKAMLHAKSINCSLFEMGQQFYLNKSLNTTPTDKELGISKFKSGFGGLTNFSLLFSNDF